MIAKILINDNPVDNDNIHILLISKQYLQILNFLYLLFFFFQLYINIIKNFF